MINNGDLVKANLIRYYHAKQELAKAKLDLVGLNQTVSAHSPALGGVKGYSGTHDEKMLNYATKKEEVDRSVLYWTNEQNYYYNVLHLFELDKIELRLLEMVYYEKRNYSNVAETLGYASKQVIYVKHNEIIKKLSLYV